jgi:protein transport protein SEC23
MSEFLELKAQDGVRMTWNVLPGMKQDAANCGVPVSAVYTPLNPNPAVPVLPCFTSAAAFSIPT